MLDGTNAKSYFSTILSAGVLDESILTHAKQIFDNYTEAKVFKSSSFEDDVWYTTDEYSNIGIHFNFNKVTYNVCKHRETKFFILIMISNY